jgi:two-component system NtrC family sensor kinase
LKLGTKLTLFPVLVIIPVLSVYGYLDAISRRDMLLRKMKGEVRSMGRTLNVALGKVSLPAESGYVQGLIDAVSEHERTLGVMIYFREEDLVLRTYSLQGDAKPYFDLIRRAMEMNGPQEEFGTYHGVPVFSYAFPLGGKEGKSRGGMVILQKTHFLGEEVKSAKEKIFFTILALIGGTVVLILWGTGRWITQPISRLMEGIREVSRGNLDYQIDLKGEDELSRMARAFNLMSAELRKARQEILQEAETKLVLERRLRESEKLATAGQLASGLAHEVGTPLNIIHGRAELIQRKLEDQEAVQKNAHIILRQTERITGIIQQLLGMVRKKKTAYQALNILAVLEATLDLLDQQIQKQRVQVVKDWSDNFPPVKGDPDQLQQVFLNLFLNAMQSMPERGTLRLAASVKGIARDGLEEDQRPYVRVEVEDTGTGMEGEVLQNLFHPFFTTKAAGTGLGLMVSLGIIRDHEGWIEVESEVGKGSVFRVYLPVWPEEGGDGGAKA